MITQIKQSLFVFSDRRREEIDYNSTATHEKYVQGDPVSSQIQMPLV